MSIAHDTIWTTAAPLWPAAASASVPGQMAPFQQPAILGFASDQFMEELIALLENEPARLGEYLAQPETWREPAPLPKLAEFAPPYARSLNRLRLAAANKATELIVSLPDLTTQKPANETRPLKLFQPAHQRFYLVVACLVCQLPGLPDRTLDVPKEERAAFVLRRRVATDGNKEYAFVSTPRGSSWQAAASKSPVENEERLPLFGMTFLDDGGRRRRLLGGLVPVGRREAYLGAPTKVPAPPDSKVDLPTDPRDALFRTLVEGPWGNLIAQARTFNQQLIAAPKPDDDEGKTKAAVNLVNLAKSTREQIQTASWYLLLDFADFLKQHLPMVWSAVGQGGAIPTTSAKRAEEQALLDLLRQTTIKAQLVTPLKTGSKITDIASSLATALKDIAQEEKRKNLESVTLVYDRNRLDTNWPNFLFPLADHAATGFIATTALNSPAALRAAVVAALPDERKPAPPLPLAAQPLKEPDARDTFVIRCVFDRPCCGPLVQPVVSEPSAPFLLASFFDPDAPARPIRIALPMDTTPSGFSKFDKNTAFMMSDVLACQMERMRGITLGDLVLSVLPWPFHKDLPAGAGECANTGAATMGMICTLSIPIITICALILLMIIVALFDFIFRWLPFFISCFPLPGFKAKES